MNRTVLEQLNESKVFHKLQIWSHSGMSALSFAFFLAYLSSVSVLEGNTIIDWVTITFSLSLGLNSFFLVINVIFGIDKGLLAKLRTVRLYNNCTWVAYLSFLSSVTMLISVFSGFAALLFITSLSFGFWLFFYSIRKVTEKGYVINYKDGL